MEYQGNKKYPLPEPTPEQQATIEKFNVESRQQRRAKKRENPYWRNHESRQEVEAVEGPALAPDLA